MRKLEPPQRSIVFKHPGFTDRLLQQKGSVPRLHNAAMSRDGACYASSTCIILPKCIRRVAPLSCGTRTGPSTPMWDGSKVDGDANYGQYSTTMQFTPDGQHALTMGGRDSVLWNVAAGKLEWGARGRAAFPDCETRITLGADGAQFLLVYPLDQGDMVFTLNETATGKKFSGWSDSEVFSGLSSSGSGVWWRAIQRFCRGGTRRSLSMVDAWRRSIRTAA